MIYDYDKGLQDVELFVSSDFCWTNEMKEDKSTSSKTRIRMTTEKIPQANCVISMSRNKYRMIVVTKCTNM